MKTGAGVSLLIIISLVTMNLVDGLRDDLKTTKEELKQARVQAFIKGCKIGVLKACYSGECAQIGYGIGDIQANTCIPENLDNYVD